MTINYFGEICMQDKMENNKKKEKVNEKPKKVEENRKEGKQTEEEPLSEWLGSC